MEHPQKQCIHPEQYLAGLVDENGNVNTGKVEGHDCEYIEARNSLIPFAEAKANKLVGRNRPICTRTAHHGANEHSVYAAAWNAAFFDEMDRLWSARCVSVQQQHQVAA